MKRIAGICAVFVVVVVLPMLYGCGGGSSPPYNPDARKKTTFMVYMVGSDLESRVGFGTENINEMKAVGSTDNVKVIVATGGANKDGWRTVKRHEVHKGSLVTLSDQGSVSMGDPNTLKDFIIWGMNAYPADRYVLVFWDHGGGAIGGFGSDEVHNGDVLTLPKIRQALADAYASTLNKFELVGFDACLMATVETAFSIKPYARYLAASEELEPGAGWDYTGILRQLTSHPNSMDGAALGKVIADTFKKKIDDSTESGFGLTFSVTDLDRLSPTLESSVAAFGAKLQGLISQSRAGWVSVASARSRSYDFATSRNNGSFCDMVDLRDLALNMKQVAPTEAANLQAAVEHAVIYNVQTLRPRAYGLTAYFPTGSIRDGIYSGAYQSIDFIASYKNMVSSYISIGLEDVNPPVFSGEKQSDSRFSATVVGDDVEGVSYFLSQKGEGGNIIMLGLTPSVVGQGGAVSMDWTGSWISLNGYAVSVFVEGPGVTSETLSVPVMVNGQGSLLLVTHDKKTGTMTINGVWPGLDAKDYMAERMLPPPKVGDSIAPGFQVYLAATKMTEIRFGKEFVLDEPATLTSAPLKAGEYSVAFFASDLAYNYGWSATATFSAGKAFTIEAQPQKTDPAFALAVAGMMKPFRGR